MSHKLINLLSVMLLSVILSACTMFAPVKIEQPQKYLLKDTPKLYKTRKHSGVILVSPITSYQLYDTEKMAYSIDPYTIDYFAKNEWALTPAKMMQPLLVKTLRTTNYYRGVMSLPSYANYNLILAVHLMEFRQLFYHDKSYYQIKLKADLIKPRTARLIASKEFVSLTHVYEQNPKSGVYAANIGLRKLLKEIAAFCMKNSG